MLEKMEYKLVENGIIALENSIDLTEKKTENENSTEKKDLIKGQNDADKKKAEIDVNKVRTAAANLPQYYTVQNGDTLSSISFKMYNSVGYVAELMEANELGEADEIHEGDKILIPSIQ